MRACVIFNPAAKGEKAKRFRRFLDEIGSECALKLTWAPGAARSLAADAVRDGFETIIAAGGDGTLNEVLNGIGEVSDGFQKARLALLPLGTVNVAAKEWGIPINSRKAWAIIKRGRERVIDLPQMEFAGANGPETRYFAQLAGAGLDARAIELVDWEQKKKYGPLAYVIAGFRALKEPPANITVRTKVGTAQGAWVLFGNGRFYGGRFPFAHAANLTDGRVDICVFPPITKTMLARIGWAALTSRFHRIKGVHYFQVESCELTSTTPTPLEMEGDMVGHLPAKLSIRARTLRIVVP